jgi:hypothetical protein
MQQHMQHPDKTLANICLENKMKHLKHKLETYVYSSYNMHNIPIYLCNIKIKHLQHPDETSETLETYSCSMDFALTDEGTSACEVDGGAWTSLCGSDTGNLLAGTASDESRPPRLLVGASIAASRPAAASKQHDEGGRGRLGSVGNAARRRP